MMNEEGLEPEEGDEEEFVTCPYCGEQENLAYTGEMWDDEAYMGSGYECQECGHRFTDGKGAQYG
jgi:DNA-directed RNA polymerase subunit M/transcription elongation factor TFIIS